MKNLSSPGRELQDLSFKVRAGEIVGFGGLAGCGKETLGELLAGATARDGAAIVLVSSELPELLGMADRIVILARERHVAEFDASRASEGDLTRTAFADDQSVA